MDGLEQKNQSLLRVTGKEGGLRGGRSECRDMRGQTSLRKDRSANVLHSTTTTTQKLSRVVIVRREKRRVYYKLTSMKF